MAVGGAVTSLSLIVLIQLVRLSTQASHYCTRQEVYNSTTTESYQASRLVRETYWCISHVICSRNKELRYTSYRQASKTSLRTVNYCCAGWEGENCDQVTQDGQVVAVIDSNAIELDAPVHGFNEAVSKSKVKESKVSARFMQLALPICLIVLIGILVLVIIYSRRRYNQFKAAQSRGDDYVVAYSTSQSPDERRPAPLLGDSETEVHEDEAGCSGCQADAPLTVKCFDDEVELAEHSMSYRSRMNDLNKEESASMYDVEEKLTNIDNATVRIYSRKAVMPSLLATQGDTQGADCSSDEDNDMCTAGHSNMA